MRSIALWGLVALGCGTGCGIVPSSLVCEGRTCGGGFVCDSATGQCVPPPAPDAGTACAVDGDCGAAAPHCLAASGTCVECLADGDCTAGTCAQNRCERLPDSCSTLGAALEPGAGPVTVHGSTVGAHDDVRLACALPGVSGRDVVYALAIGARKRLVATVEPDPGSGLVPVVGVRASCASASDADQLGCAVPALAGTRAQVVVDPVLPGTLYLWVDGEAGSEGAFSLKVALEDTTAGESCAAPIYLPLSRPALQVTGDTSALADDTQGSCGGAGGKDTVYAVQLSSPRRVAFEVTSASAGFSPLLYVRSACDDGAAQKQLACVTGSAAGLARVDLPRLEPGTYFLWVDGQSGKAGSYSLAINASDPVPAPTNDTCAQAQAVAVPAGGIGRVLLQGDTTQAKGDALGCGGTGADLVYTVTTGAPSSLEVKVAPLSGSALQPVVYLRGAAACGSELPADQFACSQAATIGGTATLAIPHLPAGTWALWVDGASASAGPFELGLDLGAAAAAPTNDTCSMPTSIALAGAPVTVTGTTWGATDQHTGCELPKGGFSPDVVYALTLSARQSVAVELKAEAGSALRPVLALLLPAMCTSNASADLDACAWADPQLVDRAFFTIPALAAGTYPVWVEGDDGTQGAFSLKLTPGPALDVVPGNDDCTLPATLQQGVNTVGDTRAAYNDVLGAGCGLPDGANGEYAPDVVYKFSLASAQTVNLTVTPDANAGQLFRPVVYVQGPGSLACGGAAAVKGCQISQAFGGTATLSLSNLAAGTYFVWVDGAGLSGGKFTIRWQ